MEENAAMTDGSDALSFHSILRWIAVTGNVLLIFAALGFGLLSLAADIGVDEAKRGLLGGLAVAASASAVMIGLTITPKHRQVVWVGYCGLPVLFVAPFLWWIRHFNYSSGLFPPSESLFVGLLATLNLVALWLLRPVPLWSGRGPWRMVVTVVAWGGVILLVVIGLGVPWAARVASQYESAQHFLRLGGGVTWENGFVVGLYLKGTHTNDDDLKDLSSFPSLRSLYLSDTQVTDAGLLHVGKVTTLEHLYLSNTIVSDTGLSRIKNLSKLQNLWLHNTNVSDAGLRYLENMSEMGYLDLGGTDVSDDGLPSLYGMMYLYYLHVPGTDVSKAGLEEIVAAIPGLRAYNGEASVGD